MLIKVLLRSKTNFNAEPQDLLESIAELGIPLGETVRTQLPPWTLVYKVYSA
jgi:hypothetical protein